MSTRKNQGTYYFSSSHVEVVYVNTVKPGFEERVIGYSDREYWQAFDESWPEERRLSFLYRLDILKPLSVDERVWPTIFASECRPEPFEKFGFQNGWSFLDDLTLAVTTEFQQKKMRAWRTIAITLIVDSDGTEWSSPIPEPEPKFMEEQWQFLGYDVCDQFALSGLMNCGFLPQTEDVTQLRRMWSPRLNQFHLFDELDDACEFKQFSDLRMKNDHAPFFVHGLWLIQNA
jgi:hypothetical protein